MNAGQWLGHHACGGRGRGEFHKLETGTLELGQKWGYYCHFKQFCRSKTRMTCTSQTLQKGWEEGTKSEFVRRSRLLWKRAAAEPALRGWGRACEKGVLNEGQGGARASVGSP